MGNRVVTRVIDGFDPKRARTARAGAFKAPSKQQLVPPSGTDLAIHIGVASQFILGDIGRSIVNGVVGFGRSVVRFAATHPRTVAVATGVTAFLVSRAAHAEGDFDGGDLAPATLTSGDGGSSSLMPLSQGTITAVNLFGLSVAHYLHGVAPRWKSNGGSQPDPRQDQRIARGSAWVMALTAVMAWLLPDAVSQIVAGAATFLTLRGVAQIERQHVKLGHVIS